MRLPGHLKRLAVLLCLTTLATPQLGFAESSESQKFEFDFAAADLQQALFEFTTLTRRMVSVDAAAIQDIQSVAVAGNLTARSALERMIAGSGLELVVVNNAAFALRPPAAEPPRSNLGGGIEEIVVYGQKIERSLRDTKESVSIYTQQIIEERNLTSLVDVYQQTPGVSGDQFGFRIRGINSGSSSQPNRSQLSSIVADGVNLSGWLKGEGVTQLWDVEQVEVLKGPQSTNVGRNSLAGAIIINTVDPVFDNEGALRVGFGSDGYQEYKGVANLNLADGVSAIRIAAEVSETDGYIDNVTRNEDDYGYDEDENVRLKWLWTPSEDARVVLSVQHLDNSYGESRILLAGFDEDDRVSTHDSPSEHSLEADLASLKIDYSLTDTWTLTSISAYQDGDRYRVDDTDLSALDPSNGGGFLERWGEDKNYSQEFRLNYASQRLRGSSGLYYNDIDARRRNESFGNIDLLFQLNFLSPGLGDALVTGFGIYPQFYDLTQSAFTGVDTEIWAVFSEWEIDLSDRWTVSFGARYDNEEQTVGTRVNASSMTTLPDPALGAPLGLDGVISLVNATLAGLSTDAPLEETNADFSNLLPHAGITYHWSENSSTTFFVKKSYRSGGSELTLLSGINEFDSEELWNYEVAHRSVLLDGRGVLNANVYYGDWTDQQVGIPEPGTGSNVFQIVVNAGEAEIYGFEASFAYQLNDELSLYVGAAISHTEYQDFVSVQGDFTGNEFAFAPERTAVFGINYQADRIYVNLTGSYTGTSYSNPDNTIELDSYAVVDITSGYEFENFKFEVFVKNLFDETYAINNNILTSAGDPMARLGAPRQYGARVTYRL